MVPLPPTTTSSSSDAPQKPLSGLSLYAGISLSSSGDKAGTPSSSSPVTSASPNPTSTTDAAVTSTTTASSAKPTSTSSWSAALRFAPRKSSSSSSGGAGNRNRPRAAIVAPSFTSSTSNPLQVDEEAAIDPDTSKGSGSSADRSQSHPAHPSPNSSAWSKIASAKVSSAIATTPTNPQPTQTKLTSDLTQSLSSPNVVPSTLALSSSNSSKYVLPAITAPPELRLTQDELEADKAKARDAAVARGERGPQGSQQDGEQAGNGGGKPSRDDWGYDDGGDWDEEEDINGFAMSSAGQKAKKKRSKRRRGHSPGRQPLAINWDADYDPRTPNDYAAWKDVVRNRREALKRMERQRKQYQMGGGDYDDDDSMDDAEEEKDWRGGRDREVDEERLKKYRRWAPPPSYGNTGNERRSTAASTFQEEQDDEEKLYISPPPTERPAFVQTATPSAPSFLPSKDHMAPPPASSAHTSNEAPSAPSRALTGEEAYQRRLAMSQGLAQPGPPPGPPPPPPPPPVNPPSHSAFSPTPPSLPSLAQAEAAGEPSTVGATTTSSKGMDLAARQSAAAAIAARLASIAPPSASRFGAPPSTISSAQNDTPDDGARNSNDGHDDNSDVNVKKDEDDKGDFASRLMAKWGHQSGQGLGVEGNQGMTEALVMNKVKATSRKQSGPKSSTLDSSDFQIKSTSLAQRGQYSTPDPRATADLQRFGVPSEVVLLYGLLPSTSEREGREDVEDDEDDEITPEEIAKECSQYGYVQRIAFFPSGQIQADSGSDDPSKDEDPNEGSHKKATSRSTKGRGGRGGRGGVIFLLFSGQVGAYKAVHDLDGKSVMEFRSLDLKGGKKEEGGSIRARYFPRRRFEMGQDGLEGWGKEVRRWIEEIHLEMDIDMDANTIMELEV